MPNRFNILFLSDAHLGNPKHGVDPTSVLSSLIEDIQITSSQLGIPQLIVFGGDLAFGEMTGSPIASQYDLAQKFVSDVYRAAKASPVLTPILLVPGNHDVNRDLVDEAQDQWILKLDDPEKLDLEVIEHTILWRRFLERQEAWASFYKEIMPSQWTFDEKLNLTTGEMNHEGVSIGVAGINSSWSCSSKDRKGSIWIGNHQYRTAIDRLKGCQFRIGVWHHPLSWLHPKEELTYRQHVQHDFNLFLHGHEHSQFLLPAAHHLDIASGACYQGSKFKNAYSWIAVDFEQGDLEVVLRTYSDEGKRGWIPFVIPGISDITAGTAKYPKLFNPIKFTASPPLESVGASEEAPKSTERISNFQDLCKILKDILDTNHTFFKAFGPNSGADGEGDLRIDLSLWEKAKREIIAPNNRRISELLTRYKDIIPTENKTCVASMVAHIYAFEKHCEDAQISYKDHLFPVCFPKMVLAGLTSISDDELLIRMIHWISEKLRIEEAVTEAHIFGSTILTATKSNDVDVAIIYSIASSSEIAEFGSRLKSFEEEFKAVFDKPLHFTVFNASEANHIPDFMKIAGQSRKIY